MRTAILACAFLPVFPAEPFSPPQAVEIEIAARNDHGKRFHGEQQTLHFAGASTAVHRPTLRQRVLTLLGDPNLALILLAVGTFGIYFEFSVPGMVLPGVAGSTCALLGLAALSALPISRLGASLILTAAIFFGLELKFSSRGVLAFGGAVALVPGCLFLVDSPLPELRIRPLTALAVGVPLALITAFLVTAAARARRNKIAAHRYSFFRE